MGLRREEVGFQRGIASNRQRLGHLVLWTENAQIDMRDGISKQIAQGAVSRPRLAPPPSLAAGGGGLRPGSVPRPRALSAVEKRPVAEEADAPPERWYSVEEEDPRRVGPSHADLAAHVNDAASTIVAADTPHDEMLGTVPSEPRRPPVSEVNRLGTDGCFG